MSDDDLFDVDRSELGDGLLDETKDELGDGSSRGTLTPSGGNVSS
jgi:hypothetical protein